MRNLLIICGLVFGAFAINSSEGQQAGAPVILQASTPTPAAPPSARATPAAASSDALSLLQEMKASNAATIEKQEAALQTLDALQKAAEEMKIYSKRG
ncbi:MAG: hypothetical protein H0X40_03470 [Chthoniobacterales bacterium]|nr:hypothetical protein [Chthoniobacterales bacterium]